ncbi:3-isopropylmalate dehydratase, small subunit [Rubritalea squalenifaciens DSM 18772]|uniref:3-isopropylmalate dehydratase n=2 Tax=Rubritalea TaxID=361050 RepID=A0A1M6DZN5_9BACT|nr:3-isopropylmalate dehydratase small subunit [Rubritalea squalenifaciens]SHI78717.1 3-isopropylmalate dehydratase, small subunit [Rubritalea squalenifaciens DSM 18772]
MAIEAIKKVTGRAVPVPGADVDTDRIIPARFLKCVTFDDLAEGMFYDERFDADGNSKGHPIDAPEYQGASIMVVGPNFGCGSSREHAPQSIRRAGFNAIVGVSFAEIFFGNSTNLGMPCVGLSPEDNEKLMELVKANPEAELSLDMEKMEVSFAGQVFKAGMDEGAREALVSGKWDVIQELVDRNASIESTAEALPYV